MLPVGLLTDSWPKQLRSTRARIRAVLPDPGPPVMRTPLSGQNNFTALPSCYPVCGGSNQEHIDLIKQIVMMQVYLVTFSSWKIVIKQEQNLLKLRKQN